MEILFFIIIGLISALSSWLQGRREKKNTPRPKTTVGRPLAEAGPKDLEAEIKRMLTGEPKAKAPEPPPSPPEIILMPAQTAPPPLATTRPDVETKPAQPAKIPAADRSSPPSRPAAKPMKERSGHDGVSTRVRRILSSPEDARTAIVSAVVLGPPKGLERGRELV